MLDVAKELVETSSLEEVEEVSRELANDTVLSNGKLELGFGEKVV